MPFDICKWTLIHLSCTATCLTFDFRFIPLKQDLGYVGYYNMEGRNTKIKYPIILYFARTLHLS